jgi:hypothetical protein
MMNKLRIFLILSFFYTFSNSTFMNKDCSVLIPPKNPTDPIVLPENLKKNVLVIGKFCSVKYAIMILI